MLDFDLAQIYGYTTKRFNEHVQRNIEKFDDDFMFRLTREEINIEIILIFSCIIKKIMYN